MKQAYPIVITRDEKFYVVFIPDFNVNTQGVSVPEAIEMARDEIGMLGCYKEDEKQAIPTPSDIKDIKTGANEIVTLVDVDFSEYRKRHDSRTVRKNVSLPYWLNEAATEAGINVSSVLQDALKSKLHLTDRI